MKRACFVLALLVSASFSAATLLQVWNKTVALSGEEVLFRDVKVDTGGNVYGYGTVGVGDEADVVVVKINPTGTTLWTNRITMPGNQTARNLVIDGAGNAYIDLTTQPGVTPDVQLRKLRGTDGGSLGTLTYNDPGLYELTFGHLVVDETGQIYWSYLNLHTLGGGSKNDIYLLVKVNASNLAVSTKTPIVMPYRHSLLQSRTRPGGGVVIMAAKPVEDVSTSDSRWHNSTLYIFDPVAGLRQISVGNASTFALDDDRFFALGGYEFGLPDPSDVISTWGRLSGQLESAEKLELAPYNPFFTDSIVTKNKNIVGVGAIDRRTTRNEECLLTVQDSQTGHMVNVSSEIIGTVANEQFDSIRSDSYFCLSAVETNGSFVNSKIHEIDEIQGFSVDSRTYPYFIRGHAMNAAGHIAIAGNSGGITLLKPRDFKDIYMGSTTIVGGTSATLNVRMYETHTAARNVTLSDNSPNVSMPATRVINVGTTIGNVVVTTTPVSSPQVVTITAAFGSHRRIFKVTVTP